MRAVQCLVWHSVGLFYNAIKRFMLPCHGLLRYIDMLRESDIEYIRTRVAKTVTGFVTPTVI